MTVMMMIPLLMTIRDDSDTDDQENAADLPNYRFFVKVTSVSMGTLLRNNFQYQASIKAKCHLHLIFYPCN